MPKFTFLDDEDSSIAYAEHLTASLPDLSIELLAPSSVEAALQSLTKVDCAGVLVDIAFDHARPGGQPMLIDGLAIAQQIRTLQTRKKLREFPVCRLSQPDKVAEYVGADSTSNDLFDAIISKDQLVDDVKPIAMKLLSLASDYPLLDDFANGDHSDLALATVLGVEEQFLDRLDSRIKLGLSVADTPAHVISKFIISKLLRRAGPLVDRHKVLVRLGVSADTDHHSVSQLLQLIDGYRYKGVFHDGYERWWWPLISQWWSDRASAAGPLARLPADQRVQVLSDTLGIATLLPIVADDRSPGTRFWTTCLYSGLPVDPSQGFPLQSLADYEPWQDVDYLCREEALRNSRDRRLSSADKEKISLTIRNTNAGRVE